MTRAFAEPQVPAARSGATPPAIGSHAKDFSPMAGAFGEGGHRVSVRIRPHFAAIARLWGGFSLI
jgi:hypothetical protein